MRADQSFELFIRPLHEQYAFLPPIVCRLIVVICGKSQPDKLGLEHG